MINCINPYLQFLSQKEEIFKAIEGVLKSGSYILGGEVKKFERNFADYNKVKYAVAVNSGTDALIIGLKASGIGSGDEVITVSNTALATISAIISVGATPVLIDCFEDTYTINFNLIEKNITRKTKAIVVVHLFGQPAHLNEIIKIANKNNLILVEDCAQACGAEFEHLKVGTFGKFAAFSFYPTKNLGAIGDGGAIITNDKSIADFCSKYRQYGWNAVRETEFCGINSRMDEIQASILNIKLKKLDAANKRRVEVANIYNKLINNPKIKKPIILDSTKHVFHLYVVKVEKRDYVMKVLENSGVNCGIHYPKLVHQNSGYKEKCKIGVGGLKISLKISKKIVSLPIYPELTDNQLEYIANIINKI
jgi:dTDP-4-amino-4,6-dideoxygalactose transaminase